MTVPTVEEIDGLSLEELSAFAVEIAALQVHVAHRLRRTPEEQPETYLTAGEVAAILRTSEDWVRHAHDLRGVRKKVGGHVRYSPSALARWQKAQGEGSR
jgi:hypothetical protein